jgi:hypothetical protein
MYSEEVKEMFLVSRDIFTVLQKNNFTVPKVTKALPVFCALLLNQFSDEEMEVFFSTIRDVRKLLRSLGIRGEKL